MADSDSVKTEVLLFAQSDEWADDVVNYMDCPMCGERNKMMVVLHPDDFLYFRCFRNSCGATGQVHLRGDRRMPVPKRRAATVAAPTLDELSAASGAEKKHLCTRYSLNALVLDRVLLGVYRPDDRYYAYLIRGPTGGHRGIHLRRRFISTVPGDPVIPKSKVRRLHGNHDGPMTSWHCLYGHGSSLLVIVEDQYSAMALDSAGISAVALMGTHCNAVAAEEIAKYLIANDAVGVVSLDSDAVDKTFKVARQINGYLFGKAVCVPYPLTGPDIKDLSPSGIQQYIEGTEKMVGIQYDD